MAPNRPFICEFLILSCVDVVGPDRRIVRTSSDICRVMLSNGARKATENGRSRYRHESISGLRLTIVEVGGAGSQMKSPIIKRSVVVNGHKTSISLEDPFWAEIKAIAS